MGSTNYIIQKIVYIECTWYIDFEKGLGFKYKVENVLVSFKVCKGVIKLPYFYIGSYFARKLGV